MSIPKAIANKLKAFTILGCDFTEMRGDEALATCPFTGDKRKFFVNVTNFLWDSKTASLSGDIHDFFEAICIRNEERAMQGVKILELSMQRGLPVEAFEGYGLGWDGEKYTLPVKNARGKVTDVRRIFLKNKKLKLYGIPNGKVGLFNGDALQDKQLEDEPVYICEGEWDTIALNWLLRKNKADGFAVGVAGANTFKQEWAELFRDRDVILCYDNDHAGAAGEQTALRRLTHVVHSMSFLKWVDDLPEGFDIRDWVSNGFKRKVFKKCLEKLIEMLSATPRIAQSNTVLPNNKNERKKRTIKKPSKHQALYKLFGSHLKLDNEDTLAVCMGTILANRMDGDPLWVMLVANSGAGKTEFLSTLEGYDECVFTAEFTPHTLVSGMSNIGGGDPSLLPKLDGKVLVIKDFTVILSMHPTGRDEIFGQLREAYDGNYTKQFGNGLTRKYNSSFGILAGVTPRIDEYTSLNAGLGERFVKYRVKTPSKKLEQDIIMSAIMSAGKETGMRSEMKEAVTDFLDNTPDADPEVTAEVAKIITAMAVVVSRLRGAVTINEYTKIQPSKATHEVGTRLAKQLVRMWKGLTLYFNDPDKALQLTCKVARGSVTDKRDEIIQAIAHLSADKDNALSGRNIAGKCFGLSNATVQRELDDLRLLGMLKSQSQKKNALKWTFSKSFGELLELSNLYE